MFVSIEEQETVINISRDEKTATIWSSDRTMWTRLDKLGSNYELLEEQKDKDGDVIAKKYLVKDKSLLSFRTQKKSMTEEQKEQARERLRRLRNENRREVGCNPIGTESTEESV